MIDVAEKIAHLVGVKPWQINNILQLFDDGATIPFIARYRKEKTGNLSDVEIIEIQKYQKQIQQLEERKLTILKSLEEQDVLDGELQRKIDTADTLAQLEDIYLPYKPKRRTKASIAIEKGLEPLAKMIMSENVSSLSTLSKQYLSSNNKVATVEEALQGARDIIAEWINERESVRNSLRRLFEREAEIYSLVIKGKEEEGEKYSNYFDWQEKASRAPSHRILAMFRGEGEGILKVKIQPDFDKAFDIAERRIIKGDGEAAEQKKMAIKDALKRLLLPSLETELRASLKQKADEAAVNVFSENLRQLLLSPPLGQKNVLAIDPGFRTGCKIVCLDRYGNLLNNDTIFPHPPQKEIAMAIKKIKSLVNAYQVEAIAIGNGTAGRETEEMIKRIRFDRDLTAVMVNESGASVYSASDIARKEFPDYDVTVRGAVSIGRRLMDPLAELVKIDPKAIGVGQYQHDINQKMLQESLHTTVELCVNNVGVELNSASPELLSYVSGIGPKLAAQIVEYRTEVGGFETREDLKKVKGLGSKAFEQSAGFLRIKDGKNPLDASAVHPESYPLVQKMSKQSGFTIDELIGNKKVRSIINAEDYLTDEIGLLTLNDILSELEKPGRDPRKDFKIFEFDKNVKRIEDIKPGMILPAIVTNITAFGAFVDLGIHESGLIHKSRIAEEFVKDPADYLKLNQQLMVKVEEVDVSRKRIGLTLIGV
jgi:protein Tex